SMDASSPDEVDVAASRAIAPLARNRAATSAGTGRLAWDIVPHPVSATTAAIDRRHGSRRTTMGWGDRSKARPPRDEVPCVLAKSPHYIQSDAPSPRIRRRGTAES